MKPNQIPFNVEIMDLTAQKLAALKPVQSLDVFEGGAGSFEESGLFSVSIFGRVGDELRDTKFSFIDIKTTVFHPLIYRALTRLKGLYGDILNSRGYGRWDPELKDFVSANELTGQTGYSFFLKHWKDIQHRESKSAVRTQRVALLRKYANVATTSKILVIPAGLRDFTVDSLGRGSQDEINDLYRRVLGVAKTVVATEGVESSTLLDNPRKMLQERFNEIYDTLELMITGKKGFVQNKWGSRKVFNGTRNVISAMDTSTAYLGGANSPKFTDTILGLFQVIKGALPLTVAMLRNGFLGTVFEQGGSSTSARLVNPKTLEAEHVDLPAQIRDRWVTVEGLEKVIESFRTVETRHSVIEVEGYYLGLIYLGPDQTFRIFSDIRELPEGWDRKYVQPLTLVQLLYLCGYRRWNTLKAIVTRYPVTGMGSTYPSTVYCKTTIVGETRSELGPDWQPMGPEYQALEFPTLVPLAFVDSQIIHPSRLEGIGGDYDGDTASATIVYSMEAIEEIDRHLRSKEAFLDPRGGFKASANVVTVEWVLRNMTGD